MSRPRPLGRLAVLLLALAAGDADPLPDGALARLGSSRLQHPGGIAAAAVSPDGDRLVSYGLDGAARVWERAGGALLATWDLGAAGSSVAWSPDGAAIAFASSDLTLTVVDARTGAPRFTRRDQGAAVAWSPDGTRLCTWGSGEPAVTLLESAGGALVSRYEAEGRDVLAAAFTPGGDRLVWAPIDQVRRQAGAGTVVVTDVARGEPVAEQRFDDLWATSLAVSPATGTVAMGMVDGSVRLWDPGDPDVRTLSAHAHPMRVGAVAFSPDGRLLASGDDVGRVLVSAPAAGESALEIPAHLLRVVSLAFGPRGDVLVTAGRDEWVRLWDPDDGRDVVGIATHRSPVQALAWSPDGERLATGSSDRTVRLWRPATGEHERSLEGHGGFVYALDWSPDGQTLASASQDGIVRSWDAATGALRRELTGHEAAVLDVAFSPDGARLATACYDRRVRVFDAGSGRLLRTLEDLAGNVFALAWSPDGSRLAAASSTLHVWDAESGETVAAWDVPRNPVAALLYLDDGAVLAAACADRTIRLVDAESGEERARLVGHAGRVQSLSASPDGTLLASSSYNEGGLRLWDRAEGRTIAELSGHAGDVASVAFSPDGGRLASGGVDTTVLVWDLGRWIER